MCALSRVVRQHEIVCFVASDRVQAVNEPGQQVVEVAHRERLRKIVHDILNTVITTSRRAKLIPHAPAARLTTLNNSLRVVELRLATAIVAVLENHIRVNVIPVRLGDTLIQVRLLANCRDD